MDLPTRGHGFPSDDRPGTSRPNLLEHLNPDARGHARSARSMARTKFLLSLADGKRDRIGLHPRYPGETFCISLAGGVRDGMRFLPDGQDGDRPESHRRRDCRQVRACARELQMLDTRFNIVLMGMGNPAQLRDHDAGAADPRRRAGLAINPAASSPVHRGVLPALERLATEPLMPNLAISLHATTEEQRDMLVPINRKYGLKELLEACRDSRSSGASGSRSSSAAEGRQRHAGRRAPPGVPARDPREVNLLPLNEAAGIPYERPSRRSRQSLREGPFRSWALRCRCASRAGATSGPPVAS